MYIQTYIYIYIYTKLALSCSLFVNFKRRLELVQSRCASTHCGSGFSCVIYMSVICMCVCVCVCVRACVCVCVCVLRVSLALPLTAEALFSCVIQMRVMCVCVLFPCVLASLGTARVTFGICAFVSVRNRFHDACDFVFVVCLLG